MAPQVYQLLDLRVQEAAEGLLIAGVIPVPGDGSDVVLPVAASGEVRAEVHQHP